MRAAHHTFLSNTLWGKQDTLSQCVPLILLHKVYVLSSNLKASRGRKVLEIQAQVSAAC